MHDSTRDAFIRFSEPLEGRVRFMYLDVKSLVSTGIGTLLDADDPNQFGSNPNPLPDIFTLGWFDKSSGDIATHDEIEQEYKNVKFSGTALAPLARKEIITRLRIGDESIDTLVMAKLDSFEGVLRGREPFAGLDDWPADGQLGLFSMAWALGPNFRFPAFQAAAAVGDWLTMARECRITEAGNPGVIPRNVRNGLLVTIAGWVAASSPPGDVTQLVYDPSMALAENMRSRKFPVPVNLAIGLQMALEVLGFDPDGLDGVFGPGTRTALTRFQSANGLATSTTVRSIDEVPPETINAITQQLDDAGISRFP